MTILKLKGTLIGNWKSPEMEIEFSGQGEDLRSFGKVGSPHSSKKTIFYYDVLRGDGKFIIHLSIAEGGDMDYEIMDWGNEDLTIRKPGLDRVLSFKKTS